MLGMDNKITGNAFPCEQYYIVLFVVDYFFFNVIRNGQ